MECVSVGDVLCAIFAFLANLIRTWKFNKRSTLSCWDSNFKLDIVPTVPGSTVFEETQIPLPYQTKHGACP